ncbi:MAG: flagellar filament capping protein FliD, partial [Defluviitaleaceae bacterium]|nr:flagellar filament capping protein FliD [Defluviitaleaceae bacterium]
LDMRNPAAGGMLVIDPTQFDAALENNIEGITALFTGQGASGMATHSQNGAPRIGDSPGGDLILGLGARLDHVLNRHAGHGGLGALAARAGVEGRETDNTLGRQIQDQDRRIDNMMRWLERRENQLFAQFSRMELAMMQGQQQMMFWDQIMWGAM